MNIAILNTLLYADILAIRTWFYTKRLSKLFIVFSFLILCWAIVWGIYFLVKIYFQYISKYETFGLLSASYVINAAILVTAVLMIMAAIASLVGFLLERSPEHEYILSLPLSPSTLPMFYFIRTSVINIFLVLIIFGPLAIAYKHIFLNGDTFFFYGGLSFILILLVLMTNCIATFISYFLAYFLKKQTIYTGILGLLIFFFTMFGIFSLIFPSSLLKISESQSINFLQEYSHFPINASWLPTVWIMTTLLKGFSIQSIFLLLITILLLVSTYLFQKKYFIKLYHHIHPLEHTLSPSQSVSRFFIQHPFLMKDYLSIVREPSEVGYIFFLSGIAVLFFVFLRIGIQRGYQTNSSMQNYLLIFTFLWFGFFVTAFLLRIVYPLMAREGINRWFIFSLPIKRKTILFQKMIFSNILIIPISIFSIIIWFFLPLKGEKNIFIFFSFITVLVLTQIQTLMGSIAPDYENGINPERVSTSAMGILTLTISFLYICIGAYLMFIAFRYNINAIIICLIYLDLSLFILLPLNIITYYFSKKNL